MRAPAKFFASQHYVYKSGNYDVRADCYHTYFSGAKAKIIETIFTKKELEDNLAF